MMKKLFLSLVVILIILSTQVFSENPYWGWKRSETPQDAMNFLNGTGAYKYPVRNAKISASVINGVKVFIIFYQRQETETPKGGWGWTVRDTPNGVYDILNGSGSSQTPVKDAKICAFAKDAGQEFYIFYTAGSQATPPGKWGWTMRNAPDEVINFLNGKTVNGIPSSIARIAGFNRNGSSNYYIFYQSGTIKGSISNWGYKKLPNPTDVKTYLGGESPYTQPIKGSETVTMNTDYYVFNNEGTKLWILNPIANERFVTKELVNFNGVVTSDTPLDSASVNSISWNSSIDGNLGTGLSVQKQNPSVGTHTIKLTGLNQTVNVTMRVFTDLTNLYKSPLSQAEIDRVKNDFQFNYVDGSAADEKWSLYNNYTFNQQSTDPSKIVAIAKIDLLRHQAFSKSLPFTGGKNLYDHLKTYVKTLNLGLGCGDNMGGGGTLTLSRPFSVWDGRSSATATDPNACKKPSANPTLYGYVNPLYLFVHEGRHCEAGEPGHTSCNGQSNMDQKLEGGSGHAQAAMYTMWVYKYGICDSDAIKTEAKSIATSLLKTRFCTTPTHSNSFVQAIVNELLQ